VPDCQCTQSSRAARGQAPAAFVGRQEVGDVEGEDLLSPPARLIQHLPERLLPDAGLEVEQGGELFARQGLGSVGRGGPTFDTGDRVVGQPAAIASPTDGGLHDRQLPVGGVGVHEVGPLDEGGPWLSGITRAVLGLMIGTLRSVAVNAYTSTLNGEGGASGQYDHAH
jgi:hypothetical protein